MVDATVTPGAVSADDRGLDDALATVRAQVRRSLLPVAMAHGLVVWLLWGQGMAWAGVLWWLAVTSVNVGRSRHAGRLAGASATAAAQFRAMGVWLFALGALEPVPLLLCARHGSLDSQYLVTMILLGLTVGGVSNLAGQLRLYVVWAFPLCLVLLGLWLAHGGVEGLGIAALVLMFFGLLGSYVRDYGALLAREHRAAQALRAERDRATAAVHARSQFFLAASHDLRQPLGAIRWYGDAVAEHARVLAHEDLAEIGTGLAAAVARSEPLLDQLLEVGRLDAPGAEALPEEALQPVDLSAWLPQAVAAWQPAALQRGLTLQVQIDRGLAGRRVLTADQALQRILDNLIGNALKFTTEGAVTVGLQAETDAAAAGSAADERVCIEVRDTGIGIAPAHVPQLFDDFFQVPRAERGAARGVGLGLAIARRHAQRLGTELRVQSTPGQGSCFSLTLPLLPPMKTA